MKQALHIFKKDVRQLRYAIVLVLAATAIFAYNGTTVFRYRPLDYIPTLAMQARPLVAQDFNSGIGFVASSSSDSIMSAVIVFAWCCLIALAIHADAIPGDRQFWLTRPINRKSLWGAKIVFALAFVNVPVFAAQAAIVAAAGVPITANLSGLIGEQVMLTALVILPAMAAASITRTMTQFVLLFLATLFIGSGAALMILPFAYRMPPYAFGWAMGALEWVSSFAAAVVVCAASFAVLFVQFMRRRTAVARGLAFAGTLATGVLLMPTSWMAPIAATMFASASGSTLTAEITRPPSSSQRYGTSATADLSIHINGVPAGTLVVCDAAAVSIEGPSGTAWRSGTFPLNSTVSDTRACNVRAHVDDAFFNARREQPVRVHSTLDVTVFGHEQLTRMRPGEAPVSVPDAGVCRAIRSRFDPVNVGVVCRKAFRERRDLVWIQSAGGRGNVLSGSMTYSPFPADLRIDPVNEYWAPALLDQTDEITIATQEPVGHYRVDAELRDVRLGDLELGVR
jgi:hypothetical protein